MRYSRCLSAIALTICILVSSYAAAHSVDNVTALGFNGWLAPFGDSGDEEYTDVWAEGTHAYLGTVGSGVAILDLDTGAYDSGVLRNPELVTSYAPTGHLDYQDIKVNGGYGYFSGGRGTDIVDLSVPSAPAFISRIDQSIGGFQNSQNIALGDGYLYQASASSPEVRVFDLANPASPTFLRSIDTGDSAGLRDLTLVDDRLYIAGAGDGAYVYDVSNVGATQPTLSTYVATGSTTASVWPTPDGGTLLVTHHEPGGELSAWDIDSTPSLIDTKSAGDIGINSYSTSEVVVVGSRAYVAWHQGGIQVMDLDELDTLGIQRAGYWFIQGTSDFTGFNGVRSVYPFLGQEQVLISDTKRGLWRFDTTAVPVDLVGDYNSDGLVALTDLQEWRQRYGSTQSVADGNGDGVVNAADYAIWRDAYASRLSATAVPEPSGLLLLAALALKVHVFLVRPNRPITQP